MPHQICRFLIVLASAAALVACEGTFGVKEEDKAAPESATTTESTTGSGATTTGVGTGSTFQGHPLDDPSSLLSKRTVYFEFDSAEIMNEDREIIQAHAQYLAANGSASVTLEGHADERGTREYNIALGERRANAVRQLMTLMGASGGQIRTVSYGEERPVADGHTEEAWRLNRRVEIIYRTR
ncbi:MAG: peptidoglycan-associated lipoprotein Pal [Gammaproteobacteria bacterium]|nr:peptidoglycan-associated lipoprotein Pal [Gammaproteobacteria bacterium]